MPHPDEPFAGFWRDDGPDIKPAPDPLAGIDDEWRRFRSRVTGPFFRLPGSHADPPPSLEERAQRCRDMGLVLCTCTGVDRNDQPRLLIYDPHCEVHGAVI